MDESVRTTGSCLDCGYDLRGLVSHHCPECGRLFDPNDATTIGPPGLRLGPVGRWATAPVGWAAWIFTAGILLAILWYARFPQNGREHFSNYRPLWPVLISFWGARLIAQLLTRARVRHVALRRRINVRRTTLVLSAGLCIAMAVHNEMICNAALRLSRPAFQRLASSKATAPVEEDLVPRPRWVGLYRIRSGYRYPYESVGMGTYFYSEETDACFSLFPEYLGLEVDDSSYTVVPFKF